MKSSVPECQTERDRGFALLHWNESTVIDWPILRRLFGCPCILRNRPVELRRCQRRKKAAVEAEDYDTAKALKQDIERLRLAGEAQPSARGGGPPAAGQPNGHMSGPNGQRSNGHAQVQPHISPVRVQRLTQQLCCMALSVWQVAGPLRRGVTDELVLCAEFRAMQGTSMGPESRESSQAAWHYHHPLTAAMTRLLPPL